MGICCSTPAPSPHPPNSLAQVELPVYDPGAAPFALSIPEAVRHFHATFPPCTLPSLQAQRDEFWHTRVEGDPQMWLVLRAACDEDDEATQEALMESAGLQRWSIEKIDGVYTYDAKGIKYEVPFYCMHIPHTLITPEQEAAEEAAAAAAAAAAASPTAAVSPVGEETGIEPGQVGGSPSVSERSMNGEKVLSFKVRFSDGIGDLAVSLPVSTELSTLRRLVKEQKGIDEERQIYFLHGQRWQNASLQGMGLTKNTVLQCFVKTPQQTA